MFAAMLGITNQPLPDRVDDEIDRQFSESHMR